MFDGLLNAFLGFIHQYEYLAVFVYMVLETSFLLHYVPSEIVVPFAASELVHDPLSFVLFVLDATAGATVGGVLAYVVFGRYGRGVLARHGHVVHVSEDRLVWGESVFVRYGESSVFWGRMLPFIRAFISIPAGLAEMDLRRFVLFSAAGALLFNTGLTYLVYSGTGETSPLGLVVAQLRPQVAAQIAYEQAHPRVVIVLAGVVVLLTSAVWLGRDWIRSYPELAKQLGLHLFRIVGVIVGGVFIAGSLASPQHAFGVIISVWNDPLFWVRLGLTEQVALLLVGVGIVFVGFLVFELGQLVEIAHLQSVLEDVAEHVRNL